MKKFTLFLAIMVLGSSSIFAKNAETVSVRLGQSRTADDGKISVKFLSIVEDSRCPMNARCVWAGNAKIKLTISKGKSAKTVELNTGTGVKTVTVSGYKFQIAELLPWPGVPHTMVAKPEMVKLSVEKVR